MSAPVVASSLVDRVRERLAQTAGVSGPPSVESIAAAIRAESGGVLGDTDLLATLRHLQTEFVGAGPLEALLADAATTDILVVGPDAVWVDAGAGLVREPSVGFDDEAAVRRLAARLALGAGRRLDDAQPWVDGQLRDIGRHGVTVRLHAVIPPIAADGTCLSLRVLRPAQQDFASLVAGGAVPTEVRDLIVDVVRMRLAFLVAGGTGAGKTTLLNSLLGLVGTSERIVCVEDAPELRPQHPHVVRLVARAANAEGAGEVPLRTLVRQALRMRPDRIVVGEVRGAEVVDLLAALNTGHDGGAGTVHANSAAEVPARLEALAALGGLERFALHSQLAAAVQVVFVVGRDGGGVRALTQIGLVRRGRDGLVEIAPVWLRDKGFQPSHGELCRLLAERS
ncbi:TadA family conjugal transfer-associated ATPase [Gordonia sp. X0973]|uniref:TadA family conjugal transfer-associated ATPase n=1 Tax=Gordonia sp. X0973 TaxID=2742602 RepID=UPI000F53C952|nr:TadA family conjugal transfer-associated ATPase [Gordonia sp. X0973]QKT06045.1 TadA family conjugal transfer-associated ATPase [Gordonia sp. X0973]